MKPSVRAICFDFDGVLVESVDIKAAVFRELFKNHRRHVQAIVRHHLTHAGTPRTEKFEYIYQHILHRPLSKAEKRRLAKRFSKLVFDKIVKCRYVPGAKEFLQSAFRHIPLYLLSATPVRELNAILRKRGMRHYFRAVYGFPTPKTTALRSILRRVHTKPRNALYIGDARADWLAAKEVGVHFMGRRLPGRSSPFPKSIMHIRDLNNFKTTLMQI